MLMPGFVPDDCCIAVKGCLSGARRAVVAGVMLVLLSSMAAGQTRDEDETYFNGLRERRLFSLAESVCLKRLEQTDLSAAERSRFTVELSRTLAEHALHVRTVEEQSDLFDRARKAIQDLLDEREPGPNALLLRSQLLFVSARQVESIR